MNIEINGLELSVHLWPIGLIILVILFIVQLRQKKTPTFILCSLMFVAYVLLVVNQTLLPIPVSGVYAESMRKETFTSFINLRPFHIGDEHVFTTGELISFAKNILLTIPFGFGIFFISVFRPKDSIWLFFIAGLAIEIAQLLISLILGFPYRVIDINDAILNIIGIWIGFGAFILFIRFFGMDVASMQQHLRHNPIRR